MRAECTVPTAGMDAQALLLAGTDRLDKALMIGQMQGKFQLVLLPQVRLISLTRHWAARLLLLQASRVGTLQRATAG